MNTRYLISLLCAGALAFACGPRSRSEPGTLATAGSSVTDKPTAPQRRTSSKQSAAKVTKLDAQLKVDIVSNEVRFAFDVANAGAKHVELSFPSGKSYDIVVVDALGREVWQWSDGRMFTQGVQNKQLGAGDAMKVSETWPKPAAAGVYTAIATLNSTNFPVEQRVEFVVR